MNKTPFIDRVVAYCSARPFFVVVATLVGIGWGIHALQQMPLDAIPDLSDPQVILFTEWKGRSPDLIEDQVTYPIVTAMVAAPQVTDVRGYSMFGMSFVYVLFTEDTDLYWARSRTLEYLAKIREQLPEGVNPVLGPDASGVGWVLQYSLIDESGQNSIADLRALQDWKLRYLLESIPGVAEVASVGGYVKQYQIQINPQALRYYGLALHDVMQKVRESNRDVGGRIVEQSEREYFIRGRGYLRSLADIENIPVAVSKEGAPVLIKQIAHVAIVPDIRRGATDFNGQGEAASAIVVARYGADAYRVIQEVKHTLRKLEASLPAGVRIAITYDRSQLIGRSIDTLTKKLIEELLVVGAVILLMLTHFRSALVPIATLPIAILLSFIPMYYSGMTSNIMSLGGIAIAVGTMVDAAIILIENCHKALERWEQSGRTTARSAVLLTACQEVARPIFFSLLVIAVAFLPIFALQGQEGRLFKPLAFTKNFAMLFAAVLAVTVAPIMIQWFLRAPQPLQRGPAWLRRLLNPLWCGTIYAEERHPVSRWLFRMYEPACRACLRWRRPALRLSIVICVLSLPLLTGLPRPIRDLVPDTWRQQSGPLRLIGTWAHGLSREFMPPLNEGDLLYMPTTLPGISIEKAKAWLQQQNKLILQFPEVRSVFGKLGRANSATDPAPLSMVETVIQLHPMKSWPAVYHPRWYSTWVPKWLQWPFRWIWPDRQRRTWEELVRALDNSVQLPGTSNAWTFPIRTRIDMLTTGIRTPIGIKIYGDDLQQSEQSAIAVEQRVRSLPGTRSVIAERSQGGYYIDIQLDQQRLAPYGLSVEQANELIEGVIGGDTLTTIIHGRERYPVNMRYQPAFRSDVEQLRRALVSVSPTKHIPLEAIAEVRVSRGPPMIKDENGFLTSWVFVDLEPEVDMARYVERLDEILQTPGLLPSGYTYSISGQFEFMERAKQRLRLVIPLTLGVIILLLYLNSHSWIRTGIVLLAVPFSLVGAAWCLWLLNYKMSIAVWVGMIALAGIDAETGIIMLLYLDLAYQRRSAHGPITTAAELEDTIVEGAVKRIRPKLMTVATLFFGLLPIMWSGAHEAGADVMKRIAAPLIGGVFSSFLMELLIYPCIYMMWRERTLGRREA